MLHYAPDLDSLSLMQKVPLTLTPTLTLTLTLALTLNPNPPSPLPLPSPGGGVQVRAGAHRGHGPLPSALDQGALERGLARAALQLLALARRDVHGGPHARPRRPPPLQPHAAPQPGLRSRQGSSTRRRLPPHRPRGAWGFLAGAGRACSPPERSLGRPPGDSGRVAVRRSAARPQDVLHLETHLETHLRCGDSVPRALVPTGTATRARYCTSTSATASKWRCAATSSPRRCPSG